MRNKSIFSIVSVLIGCIVYFGCGKAPYAQGERLYNAYCVNCHMEDGSGLRGLIPPLNQANYLTRHPQKVACLIRNGMEGPIMVNGQEYNQEMPGYPDLTEAQVANIINYIRNSWDNQLGFTPLDSVFQWLDDCKEY